MVSNPDLAMIRYLELAKISRSKQQSSGGDRFLILAGASACRAGYLDVAEMCRARVLAHNPHHLLHQWPSLPDALRSEDFSSFLRQLERFCSGEKAESLLAELGADVALGEDASSKEIALAQLMDPVWGTADQSLNKESEPGASGKTG